MDKKLKRGIQYLFSLALMVAFLYWAFREVNLDSLGNTLRSLSPTWVAVIVLTTLGTLVLRAWRWIALMRPFAPHVTVRDATLALAICYTANMVIPRSGEALRAISLKWTHDLSLSSTLATVLVERILDLIWLAIFLGAAFLLLRDRLAETFPWLASLGLLVLCLCVAFLAFLALLSIYRSRALGMIERLLGRLSLRLASRTSALLSTFFRGFQTLHRPSAYLELALSSTLLNLGYVLIIYEAFFSFGFDRAYALGLEAALAIMVLSAIGVIFPTPGAVGSYHAFFGKSLIHLYGVPPSQALACATAVHAIATLTYLALGSPALFWQHRLSQRRIDP